MSVPTSDEVTAFMRSYETQNPGQAIFREHVAAALFAVNGVGRSAQIIDALVAALEPFANLAKPLVDDGADVAIGLRNEHFEAARAALRLAKGE